MTTEGKSSARRWSTIAAGIVFSAYGILGVRLYRDGSIPVREIAPAWWYLAASGPGMIAIAAGLALSSKRRCWSDNRVMTLLLVTILLSQMCVPVMYAIYFIEGSLACIAVEQQLMPNKMLRHQDLTRAES